MTHVAGWVREIVEDATGPCPVTIGSEWRINGVHVRIVAGQYWGTYGVSNFWHWREVRPDGSLGNEGCGYGRWTEWEPA